MRLVMFLLTTALIAGCSSHTVGPTVASPQVTHVPPPPITGTVVVQPDQ